MYVCTYVCTLDTAFSTAIPHTHSAMYPSTIGVQAVARAGASPEPSAAGNELIKLNRWLLHSYYSVRTYLHVSMYLQYSTYTARLLHGDNHLPPCAHAQLAVTCVHVCMQLAMRGEREKEGTARAGPPPQPHNTTQHAPTPVLALRRHGFLF